MFSDLADDCDCDEPDWPAPQPLSEDAVKRMLALIGEIGTCARQRLDQIIYDAWRSTNGFRTRGAPWLNAAISDSFVVGLRPPDRLPCASLLAIATGQDAPREIPSRDGSSRGTPRGERSSAESLAFFSQNIFAAQHHP